MSTYRPYKQGKRDAREGKPRFVHQSAWNQQQYDRGYAEGQKQRQQKIAEDTKWLLHERTRLESLRDDLQSIAQLEET